MKKISYYFLAALSIFAVSSCAKDILEVEKAPAGAARTFVLDLGSVTRTNITEAGKTIWAKGDKVLLTDGAALDTIAVPEAAEGQPTAEITTTKISGETVYAIYPIQAVASTTPSSIIAEDGTVNVKIPADQGGDFADANIMVGKATDLKFAMKNVAAVLKIHAATGVEKVVFNASGDALAGKLAVSFGEDNTVSEVKASGTTGILTLNAMGGDADFYVAVAPGTYKTGFNLIALDNEGKFESKKTGSENTLKVNELADLGVVGAPENMKGFEGEGTEAAPYKIGNIGEMMAFANTVNTGMKYKGKNFKLTGDISGVTLPIGYYIAADNQGAFAGTFDGDNHTVTVDLDGVNCKSTAYVAMFGLVDSSAVIKNVKVAGKVETTGNYAAGLVGYARAAASDSVRIENCVSSVSVKGAERVGGIAGYATYTMVTGCENTGSIECKRVVGGMVGYAYQMDIQNCKNSGAITANTECGGVMGCYQSGSSLYFYQGVDLAQTSRISSTPVYGVGGIVGWSQNTNTVKCVNSGAVSGVSKVAGISGTNYWSSTIECSNSGTITGSDNFVGGVVAYVHQNGNTNDCVNTGNVTGACMVGGVLGYAATYQQGNILVQRCKNSGNISGTGVTKVQDYNQSQSNVSGVGGIAGGFKSGTRTTSNACCTTGCENTGDITGTGTSVGGIVGFYETVYNNTNGGYVDNSVNKGKITGASRVGGIIGAAWMRFSAGSTMRIKNSENTGDVLATAETGWSSVGGIVGWAAHNSSTNIADKGAKIYNALNTGKIQYTGGATPAVGGIVGYSTLGVCENAYNGGSVGIASGTMDEGAERYIGALVGYVDQKSSFNYDYYLSAVAPSVKGAASPAGVFGVNISEVNAAGDLVVLSEDSELVGNVLNIFDNDCSTVVDALNAWSDKYATSNYYYWAKGPVFTKE